MRDVDREMRAGINPEHLETTLSQAGKIAMDAGDPLTKRGARFGQIRAIYTPFALRPGHDALVDMRRLQTTLPEKFPELDIAFTEVKPGPPTGRALQVEISSNDTEAGMRAARNLEKFLLNVEGASLPLKATFHRATRNCVSGLIVHWPPMPVSTSRRWLRIYAQPPVDWLSPAHAGAQRKSISPCASLMNWTRKNC